MQYPALWDSKGGKNLLTVSAIHAFIAIVFVALRLWSRKLHSTPLVLNDYAAILGLLGMIGVIINAILSVVLAGGGQHEWDIEPSKRGRLLVYLATGQPLLAAAVTAIRVSIIHLYLELFPGKVFRKICFVIMALSIVYSVSLVVEAFAYCQPVAYSWNKAIGGTCKDPSKSWLAAAIINTILDVLIVLLPMPMLWRLQIPALHRIAVTLMFSIGLGIFAVDATRIASFIDIQRLGFGPDLDYSYLGVSSARCTILEAALGLDSACLPVMRSALQKCWDCLARLWPEKWKRRVSQQPPWQLTWLSATNRYPTVNVSDQAVDNLQGDQHPLGDMPAEPGLRHSVLESVEDDDLRKSCPSATYQNHQTRSYDVQTV